MTHSVCVCGGVFFQSVCLPAGYRLLCFCSSGWESGQFDRWPPGTGTAWEKRQGKDGGGGGPSYHHHQHLLLFCFIILGLGVKMGFLNVAFLSLWAILCSTCLKTVVLVCSGMLLVKCFCSNNLQNPFLEHIGEMSVSGYSDRWFKPWLHHLLLCPWARHFMLQSTRLTIEHQALDKHPREGCLSSAMSFPAGNSHPEINAFLFFVSIKCHGDRNLVISWGKSGHPAALCFLGYIMLGRVRGGMKAWKMQQRKQFQKTWEKRLKRRLLNKKITEASSACYEGGEKDVGCL